MLLSDVTSGVMTFAEQNVSLEKWDFDTVRYDVNPDIAA